jgi:ABC-type amino acid transport substrate-binding protein
VNEALQALKDDGTLESIQEQWLSEAVSVPFLG